MKLFVESTEMLVALGAMFNSQAQFFSVSWLMAFIPMWRCCKLTWNGKSSRGITGWMFWMFHSSFCEGKVVLQLELFQHFQLLTLLFAIWLRSVFAVSFQNFFFLAFFKFFHPSKLLCYTKCFIKVFLRKKIQIKKFWKVLGKRISILNISEGCIKWKTYLLCNLRYNNHKRISEKFMTNFSPLKNLPFLK